MKKFIIKDNRHLVFDPETLDINVPNSSREGISRIFLMEEEMEIVGNNKTVIAKPGDIVIMFYDDVFKNNPIVITSEEWKENIIAYNEHQQQAKLGCGKCYECNDLCEAANQCNDTCASF